MTLRPAALLLSLLVLQQQQQAVSAIRLEGSMEEAAGEADEAAEAAAEKGTVDGTYAYAAPGSAKPPLRNPLSKDGCFPGLRLWTTKRRWFGNLVDLPVVASGLAGYRHPYMDAVGLDVRSGGQRTYKCAEHFRKVPKIPRGIPDMLHEITTYEEYGGRLGDFLWNVSHIGMPLSYVDNPTYVANHAASKGWRLVASAFFEGTQFYGGIQSSFLLQSPYTLECMLTFKGTGSIKDLANDLESVRSHFCGLVAKPCKKGGERCRAGKGESFVHRGFRDRLRQIVRTTGFQTEIRPALAGCAKVYTVGHSLGAAMAELFSACVARAPEAGEYGYESDYRYMGWTKSTPRPLFLGVSGKATEA